MNFLIETGSPCVNVVLAIVVIAVGAAVVRPVRPTAGLLLVGSGIVSILSDCCPRVTNQVLVADDGASLPWTVVNVEGLLGLVLWFGLTIAAVAMLAPDETSTPPAG